MFEDDDEGVVVEGHEVDSPSRAGPYRSRFKRARYFIGTWNHGVELFRAILDLRIAVDPPLMTQLECFLTRIQKILHGNFALGAFGGKHRSVDGHLSEGTKSVFKARVEFFGIGLVVGANRISSRSSPFRTEGSVVSSHHRSNNVEMQEPIEDHAAFHG